MQLILYITTCILLILHEIESAYEKEWEILRLPGGITGFLLMHIPILAAMFCGLYWLDRDLPAGNIISIVVGAGGLLPLAVHKIVVYRKDAFNKPVSNIIIACGGLTGIALIIVSILNI